MRPQPRRRGGYQPQSIYTDDHIPGTPGPGGVNRISSTGSNRRGRIYGGYGHNSGAQGPQSEYTLVLPEMHAEQFKAFDMADDPRTLEPDKVDDIGVAGRDWFQNSGGRFRAMRCGRRFGKTQHAIIEAVEAAAAGKLVGWFAPNFKTISEAYLEIASLLAPMKASSNKDKFVRTHTGGMIEFWSLENEDAGRSRKYDLVVIDEAAFGPPTTFKTWERAIKPTLTDRFGRALVVSNTKGALPDNFFWRICREPQHEFICFHAPTINNPTIPETWGPVQEKAAVEALGPEATTQQKRDWLRHQEEAYKKARSHPLVYAQEYGAEFVNWSGDDFFNFDNLLVEGQPVAYPKACDLVFAIMDTATKTGSKNDGTGVTYWARQKHHKNKLILLDWEVRQIEGTYLDDWMPAIFARLQELAAATGARMGSRGCWIEDKNSGAVLIQTLHRKQMPAHQIDTKLTSVGKDERALAVASYVNCGEVKISEHAYNKRTIYRGQEMNHFQVQVSKFRIGVDSGPGGDDLLDCFTYGISIGLGNYVGF